MRMDDDDFSENFIDRTGKAARPRVDDTPLSQRSLLWWIFFMPGTVILLFDYMFPNKITGVFASSRRRHVPLFQIAYSLMFYGVLILISIALAS